VEDEFLVYDSNLQGYPAQVEDFRLWGELCYTTKYKRDRVLKDQIIYT
jgi:hypothetical protein